jgi:flap endonuclease-1
MGIKNLNRFLNDNCTSKSIRKQHLSNLRGKCIVIDISIYMYRFQTDNLLLENMRKFIETLLQYYIKPIFVFDGQPPPEKKDLIRQRALLKKEAESKYNELINTTDESSKELTDLKKQFVRIHDTDITKVKELLDELNMLYLEAPGEADKLCVFLVKTKKAWACLSDDMDMFVYGCSRVIRNFNMEKHTVIYYDLPLILEELELSLTLFKEIMVLSGTDYNIHEETTLEQTIKWLYKYKRYCKEPNVPKKTFYEWLIINTNYIYNYEELKHVYAMFTINGEEFKNMGFAK